MRNVEGIDWRIGWVTIRMEEMVRDPRVEQKMGCSGSVTRPDNAVERQLLSSLVRRNGRKKGRRNRNPRDSASPRVPKALRQAGPRRFRGEGRVIGVGKLKEREAYD
jgi:hypothetical protein